MDTYNIALDCIDKNAQSLLNKHKPALIYVREVGAVREPPLRLTFSNLEGLTNRIANALKDLSLTKGERLVIRLENCPEFPISFLGTIKAGLLPIPTSPQFTWNELKHILEDSEASVLVTTEELLPKEIFADSLPSLKHIICITQTSPNPLLGKEGANERSVLRFQDLLKNSSPRFITEPTLSEDPAFWLYTSGTEGKPKAVIHAHRSIPAHDARAKLWQDLKFNDVIFNTSSLNWSYALTSGMLDLWRHGLPTLIYNGPLLPEKICHLIKHFGVTVFMSVPGIYRRLGDYFEKCRGEISSPMGWETQPLPGLRTCNSAGEKLSEEIREKFKKYTGLEIYEGLGMTEHSVYLAQRVGDSIVEGSCGKALSDQKIAILDEQGNELPPNTPGILASHKSCPGLMFGYKDSDLPPTLSLLPHKEGLLRRGRGNTDFTPSLQRRGQGEVDNWFLSGDIAQQDEQGNFFFLGRRDDVITAGGYRISPLEIESVLNEMEEVSESAVIGKEEPGKSFICAFIVLNEQTKPSKEIEEKILSQSMEKLAKYKLPKKLIFVTDLPKTSNGKIQRKELTAWPIS